MARSSRREPGPSRSHQKRELYRLVIARSDILAAGSSAAALAKHVRSWGDDLFEPLYHATVVSYGRPFSQNKPLGPLPAKWAHFPSAAMRALHARLLETRNKLVAHSDHELRAVHLYPPGSSCPAIGVVKNHIAVNVATYYLAVSAFPRIRRLCMWLVSRLTERIDSLLQELYATRVLPAASFELTFDEKL